MSDHIDIASLLASTAKKHLIRASQSINSFDENKECIQAIIIFQVAMEAIINEEIYTNPQLSVIKDEEFFLNKKYKSLSFKNKWKKVFFELQIKDTESLADYFSFYSKYRGPISHPRTRYQSIKKYTYKQTLEGLTNGWQTCVLLYSMLNKSLTSWTEL